MRISRWMLSLIAAGRKRQMFKPAGKTLRQIVRITYKLNGFPILVCCQYFRPGQPEVPPYPEWLRQAASRGWCLFLKLLHALKLSHLHTAILLTPGVESGVGNGGLKVELMGRPPASTSGRILMIFVSGKMLLKGGGLTWFMRTLLTSLCINQRVAGQMFRGKYMNFNCLCQYIYGETIFLQLFSVLTDVRLGYSQACHLKQNYSLWTTKFAIMLLIKK